MIWEFHPEAELELIEAATRYESEIPGLGKRFSFEVERAISLLLENPMIGVAVDDQIRHFVLRTFPFSLIYANYRDVLFILAVAHGNRRPGYWRSRTG